MNRIAAAWLCAALLAISGQAAAWSNHALGTWQALSVLPEMNGAAPVAAESLESFLAAEAGGLEQLLEREERWARSEVPLYPPRPDAIAFKAAGAPAQLRERFLAALRINPAAKLTLFLQTKPGVDVAGKATLPWTEITTLRRGTTASRCTFLALHEGERVAPLEVVASASDEPDYGLDIGLWENNETRYGKSYRMGKQPFGNPALEFATQAPLHMGFYHEPAIIYAAAGFLKRTYPEYRIHLYRSLAAYALRSGHPYWGWRFAGWALHYVQDLTQPYHATVVPGVGVPRLLWINSLDMLGLHTQKEQTITLVSNRHLALENYQYRRMRHAYLTRQQDDALLRAARDVSASAGYATYSDAVVRNVVSAQSHAAADDVDRTLAHTLPPKYIADPAYVFSETEAEIDLFAVLDKSSPSARDELGATVAALMRQFGAHTRAFIYSLQAQRSER